MRVLNLTLKSLSILQENFRVLARLTLPIFLVYLTLNASSTYYMIGKFEPAVFAQPTPAVADSSGLLVAALSVILALLLSALMAVRVHRFVLKDDTSFSGATAFGIYDVYIWRGFKLALIAVGLFIVIFLLTMIFLPAMLFGFSGASPVPGAPDPLPFWFDWLNVVLVGVITVFLTRLSLVLPAAAVGKPLKLSESFKATKGQMLAIVVVTVLSWGLGTILNEALAIAIPIDPLAWGLQSIASWPFMLWAVVVLTTLYGHCIEGRSLTT